GFTFRASDGVDHSNLGAVGITVTPVNSAPVAVGDSYTADEEGVTIPAPGVLANDTDVDSAVEVAAGPIILAWEASVDTAVRGFILLYGTAPGDYTSSLDVGNTTLWSTTQLTAGTTYYFVVMAYNDVGERSPITDEVNATVPAIGAQESGTLAAVMLDGPAHGAVVLGGDGGVSYTPPAHSTGAGRSTPKASQRNPNPQVA